MEEENDSIGILLNVCYGGWSPSQKAIELYNERKIKETPDFEPIHYEFYLPRDDPILVEIWKELGDDFDDKYSNTKCATIEKKYKNYYVITEYDGKESFTIDYNRYKNDNIKKILYREDLSDAEKIEEIKKYVPV